MSSARRLRLLLHDDTGATSVETAFGIGAISSVLMVAVAGIVATATYLSAVDAAGGIARAEARGDKDASSRLREAFGGSVDVQTSEETVTVTVRQQAALLPLVATATALKERT